MISDSEPRVDSEKRRAERRRFSKGCATRITTVATKKPVFTCIHCCRYTHDSDLHRPPFYHFYPASTMLLSLRGRQVVGHFPRPVEPLLPAIRLLHKLRCNGQHPQPQRRLLLSPDSE